MPNAKQLPSGSWRCQAYSHSVPVLDEYGFPAYDKNGKQKMKRIYVSFTSNDKKKGKKIVENQALDFSLNRDEILATKEREKNTITYGTALDNYLESRSSVLSPATIREYKRSRRRDMQELMNLSIYDITQEIIQTAINKEACSHSPKTVRNMHGLLSAVMKVYRPDFNLNTRLPQKIKPKLYIPTDNDIKILLQHVSDDEMMIAILLAAFGPMRRSEICALESTDIKNKIIHVQRAIVMDENKKWVEKSTKSFAGDRFIPLPDFIYDKMKGIQGRIIQINPSQVSDRFIDIQNASGLPHFRFHDLRHYCASIQHAMGIPDAYIMQRGGWGSDAVLKQVYRHALSDQEAKMNNVANKHFEELCNTKYHTK